MRRRLSDVGTMDEAELREFILERCEGEIDRADLRRMKRQELLDYIVDNGFPTLYRFHSECQADGNNPMLAHCEGEEEREEYFQRCANR